MATINTDEGYVLLLSEENQRLKRALNQVQSYLHTISSASDRPLTVVDHADRALSVIRLVLKRKDDAQDPAFF